jgi:protein-S-isoprenylcysteine O-methyltransferase Ste14
MDLMEFGLTLDASTILFVLSLIGGTLLLALALASTAFRTFEFFPPPSKKSWQSIAFISLFRLFLYPLIVLSFLEYEHPAYWSQTMFGFMLLVIGFGTAFLITFQIGWRNAFGEKRGLQTAGWFRFSRNPVYLATIVGLIGWSTLLPQTEILVLICIWVTMYLVAPFFEEPWLENQYGEKYAQYKARTPRFIVGCL